MAMAVPVAQTTTEGSRRFTVDEVMRMSEAGILRPEERLELDDGVLVVMSPEGVNHANAIARILTALARRYPESFQVRSQSGLPLGTHDYVEPDVVVVRGQPEWGSWPSREAVILVVEVAQSSIRRDTGPKLAAYAAWGVSEYWIVDMNRGCILVHRDPAGDHYATIQTYVADPVALPGLDVTLDPADVIPPAGKSRP